MLMHDSRFVASKTFAFFFLPFFFLFFSRMLVLLFFLSAAFGYDPLFPNEAVVPSQPEIDLNNLISSYARPADNHHDSTRVANHAKRALIPNGGFESNAFPPWAVNAEAGSNGNAVLMFHSATRLPISNNLVVSGGFAGSGTRYTTSDQGGPGSYIWYQPFTVKIDFN